MHSRIFAISTDENDSRYFDVPECFVPVYADYYDDVEDFDGSIEWLTGFLDGYQVDYTMTEKNRIVFHNVKPYLEAMYKLYVSAVQELAEVTLERFCETTVSSYALNAANRDRSGFWFLIDDEYAITLQEFMRRVKPETPYYIGRIYDYHM